MEEKRERERMIVEWERGGRIKREKEKNRKKWITEKNLKRKEEYERHDVRQREKDTTVVTR